MHIFNGDKYHLITVCHCDDVNTMWLKSIFIQDKIAGIFDPNLHQVDPAIVMHRLTLHLAGRLPWRRPGRPWEWLTVWLHPLAPEGKTEHLAQLCLSGLFVICWAAWEEVAGAAWRCLIKKAHEHGIWLHTIHSKTFYTIETTWLLWCSHWSVVSALLSMTKPRLLSTAAFPRCSHEDSAQWRGPCPPRASGPRDFVAVRFICFTSPWALRRSADTQLWCRVWIPHPLLWEPEIINFSVAWLYFVKREKLMGWNEDYMSKC